MALVRFNRGGTERLNRRGLEELTGAWDVEQSTAEEDMWIAALFMPSGGSLHSGFSSEGRDWSGPSKRLIRVHVGSGKTAFLARHTTTLRPGHHIRPSGFFAEHVSGSEDAVLQAQIDLLARDFEIADFVLVNRYLRRRPHLVAFLFEVRDQFGGIVPEPTMHLELLQDEESTELQLYAVARVPVDHEKAATIQQTLDQEWWLDASVATEGDLNLVVEPATLLD